MREALAIDIGPNCRDLTPEEWANSYNLYAFNLTPGPIGTVRSPARLGSDRLEIRFSAQTTVNISVVFCFLNIVPRFKLISIRTLFQ